ncbi:hypothetical protein Q7P37_009082 [Cladosporium fusiforme]
MAKETVVITGATGFIGVRVLQLLLQKNYNIRIVVRSDAKAESLRKNPHLKGIEHAEFVVVPDLLVPGALDKAAAGADSIVHLASPIPLHGDIPPERQHDELIVPAVNATLRALEAAQKSGSVKRVVITSSCVAIIPPAVTLASDDPPSGLVPTGDDRLPELEPPFANTFVAYFASKIAALNASDKFIKEQKPAFDVVNIMPPYVIGRNLLANKPGELFEGTNAIFLALLTGNSDPSGPPEVGISVHVDDVALLHVMSLDRDKIKTKNGVENFFVSKDVVWDDIPKIAAEKLPEAVKAGKISVDGSKKSKPGLSNSDKVEKTFGIKLKSVEDMVVDVTGQYIELLEKA